MAKKEIKKETAKKVIKCASKADYKAICYAIDECKMHHLFEQVVNIARVDKAKRIVVEYVPDFMGGWLNDEFWMLANLPVDKSDVFFEYVA